jgi:hypothetical protein
MNFYFYKVSSQAQNYPYLDLTRYRCNNGWNLYLDKGWTKTENYFYKGEKSSYCKIYVDPVVRIETNKLRDFPIYHNETEISNFKKLDNIVPVDGVVEVDQDIKIQYQKGFYPRIATKPISFKDCHDILYDAVIENVGTFASMNKRPVYIPKQGGIDTLTVRSVFDFLGVDYQIFDLPKEAPVPSSLKAELAKNYWGFNQVEEKENAVIVTGFYGDEWVLRNPYYVHALLSSRGINLTSEFDGRTSCYMKNYFEHYREKCSQDPNITVEELISQICNDFQIWHVNDTRYFSPLKHESLIDLLTADSETVIEQITDAKLSKSIIEKCSPGLLDLVDSTKNKHDPDYFWPA